MQKRTYIEYLVDEVREVFVVGALVSGCVGRELSGSGVQRPHSSRRGTTLEVGSWPAGPDEAIIATVDITQN
jgi:hypothetical protein